MIGLTMALALALMWIFVVAIGAQSFKVRYVHAALLIFPAWMFMVVERGRPSAFVLNLFALVMAVLASVHVGERVGKVIGVVEVDCGRCLEMWPYPALASQLRAAGFGGTGTILATREVAGNMRVRFPDTRVIDPVFPERTWPPPSSRGVCLLLWPEDDHGSPASRMQVPDLMADYLVRELQGDYDAPHTEGIVEAPMLAPAKGEVRLGFRIYPGANGDCR